MTGVIIESTAGAGTPLLLGLLFATAMIMLVLAWGLSQLGLDTLAVGVGVATAAPLAAIAIWLPIDVYQSNAESAQNRANDLSALEEYYNVSILNRGSVLIPVSEGATADLVFHDEEDDSLHYEGFLINVGNDRVALSVREPATEGQNAIEWGTQ